MPALAASIHDLGTWKVVDARRKAGHDAVDNALGEVTEVLGHVPQWPGLPGHCA
jgi:hypothetical protein